MKHMADDANNVDRSALRVPSSALLLCEDMIFTSRIVGTAEALGLSIKTAKDQAALQELAKRQAVSCVIIDLANPGLNISALIDWLRQNCTPTPRTVAYGAHVNVESLKKAREAGCDLVLPRSKFAEDLPRALPQWLGAAEKPS
jgi:CheY-like chemotaxis protein